MHLIRTYTSLATICQLNLDETGLFFFLSHDIFSLYLQPPGSLRPFSYCWRYSYLSGMLQLIPLLSFFPVMGQLISIIINCTHFSFSLAMSVQLIYFGNQCNLQISQLSASKFFGKSYVKTDATSPNIVAVKV